jgi:ribonuclease-3
LIRSDDRTAEGLAELQLRLGHRFADEGLLARALTHASALEEGGAGGDYQRLEFLGDRVLGLAVARMLYRSFPDAPEGELAQRYNALVRRETCAEVAVALGIDRALKVSQHKAQSGGGRKTAILADACEAVLAAVLLDGGFEAGAALVEREWGPLMARNQSAARDPKGQLQEWLQGRGLEPPVYAEVGRSGPDHAPMFTIRVSGPGIDPAEGIGPSKRDAEQSAARAVLTRAGLLDDLATAEG